VGSSGLPSVIFWSPSRDIPGGFTSLLAVLSLKHCPEDADQHPNLAHESPPACSAAFSAFRKQFAQPIYRIILHSPNATILETGGENRQPQLEPFSLIGSIGRRRYVIERVDPTFSHGGDTFARRSFFDLAFKIVLSLLHASANVKRITVPRIESGRRLCRRVGFMGCP
jgi:hypothetical protein